MMSDVVISGSGWVQATKTRLFVPRLNNAYEQYLYERVLAKTGLEYWYLKQFSAHENLEPMSAVEQAFGQAIESAGLKRKIRKKLGARTGVIYIDHYGPSSILKENFNIKEMYQADIFPTHILHTNNISGFSFRLRGERNASFQAMKLAADLIKSGELDVAFVGGVNLCNSFLFLSEALETQAFERANGYRCKRATKKRQLAEAASFVVLESSEHAEKREHEAGLNILSLASHRESFKGKDAISELDFLALNNPDMPNIDSLARVWYGLFPSTLISETEKMLLADYFGSAKLKQHNLSSDDFACLNLNQILHLNFSKKNTQEKAELIHGVDRSGFAWNLAFQ